MPANFDGKSRSRGEYLDFGDFWILSSWIPRFSIGNHGVLLKIMENHGYPRFQILNQVFADPSQYTF